MAKTIEARVGVHHGEGCTCTPLDPIEMSVTPVMVDLGCPARSEDPRPAANAGRVIVTWPAPTTSGVLPIYGVTVTDADSGEQILTGFKLALTLGTDTGYEGDIIEAEITALVDADGHILGSGAQPIKDEAGFKTGVFRYDVAEMRIAAP